MKLVQMKGGTGVLTDDGPILILDMIKAVFAINEIIEEAHIEEIEGYKTRFTFDAYPEVYDILTGWGAEAENDEEDSPAEADADGEDDARDLPKTLPPIAAKPVVGAPVPLFPPFPVTAHLAAVPALPAERLTACAA